MKVTLAASAMPALQDPEFVRALRLQMLQFAVGRLGDAHLAEDVVQDALMGAFINADQYSERAALRTWVFGILKHKIADTERAQQRLSYAKPLNDTNLSDAPPEWLEERLPASAQTQNPITQVEAAQFEQVLGGCMGDLTVQQAQVFDLRALNDLDPQEIGQRAGIGIGHVHVLLHRAKAKLRHCLEHHWLGRKAKV